MSKTQHAVAASLFAMMALLSSDVHARTIVQEFIDGVNTTGAAVVNFALGRIHPSFIVDRDEGAGGVAADDIEENDAINIGNTTDGIFDSSRYAEFDVNGGSNPALITLDSSRVYNFKSFTLNSGVTLTCTGSSPLRIRVQGELTVAGTIDVSGGDGAGSQASSSGSPAGGIGKCGGAAGGSGGAGTGNGATGGHANGAVGGGSGGASGTPADGGGGAGYATAGLTGVGGTAAGNSYDDGFVGLFLGGSGGGGGGGNSGTSAFGASGGGGGGVVFLQSGGKMTISGSIISDGGDGGDGGATAGNGGGGSGGAIVLFSGGNIELNGTLRARGGTGPGAATGAGSGEGSAGRIRFVSIIGDITGTGSYDPGPSTPTFGRTYYTLNQQSVVTDSYDAGNSAPTYVSATANALTPGASTATVEIAGSSDDFTSDDTGFFALTDLSALAGKRYYRFRVTLQATDGGDNRVDDPFGDTPYLESVTLEVNDREQPVFSFSVGSCAGVSEHAMHGTAAGGLAGGTIMALWLWLVLAAGRRFSRRDTTNHSTPPSTPRAS